MSGRSGRILAASVALLAVILPTGCSDSGNKPPKMRRLEGIAKRIDLKSGIVSMQWKNDKGKEMLLEGSVRENAEIWINGRAQGLGDIREGDRVVVYGFREKKGGEEKLIATKIEVTRAGELDWKTVGRPTTQPADKDQVSTTATPR